MTNVDERLVRCFGMVFPALPESGIQNASPKTVKEWDSVAAITLVTVLEEEFEVSLDFEVMAELDSFPKIAAYLHTL
jgi:acyl carrier protein